ncbi:MAG TPA: IS21 family transposase [Steroidobacteraceae bacterium]
MGVRSMTVRRFEEIRRRLSEGRGLREIARALGVSRDTVREVRDGLRNPPGAPKAVPDPLWMLQLDWPPIIHDLGLGHPLKFLWEEKAQHLTTYSNFWKQFYRKFPQYRQASVTAREFTAGERVEVDYAGDPIAWVDMKTGEIHHAWVFVSVLGFSQLLYARAAEDMQSRNWLGCHRRMFAFYGGVMHVVVPDCLKTGVLKCHLYDPDLNPAYAALGVHFATAIVAARPGHPKDKALVENGVRLLMRYQRFRYRRTTFTSLAQVNQALEDCVKRINERRHTRFGVSRRERFEALEKAALKPLPQGEFDGGEWKTATLHPDCYVSVEGDYYSAPHIHRHKKLRIKLTENQVEIFLDLARLAIHPRSRHKEGRRIKIDEHFPPNSVAYYETTPQKLLSQSRFIHPDLHVLFVELFNADVYGHLRRAQGFVRACTKEINTAGHETASVRIAAAIATMRRYNRYRVPYFEDLIAQARKQALSPATDREIVRRPGNPMLRYVGGVQTADIDVAVPTIHQESLKL